jgi:hypothetical protein
MSAWNDGCCDGDTRESSSGVHGRGRGDFKWDGVLFAGMENDSIPPPTHPFETDPLMNGCGMHGA